MCCGTYKLQSGVNLSMTRTWTVWRKDQIHRTPSQEYTHSEQTKIQAQSIKFAFMTNIWIIIQKSVSFRLLFNTNVLILWITFSTSMTPVFKVFWNGTHEFRNRNNHGRQWETSSPSWCLRWDACANACRTNRGWRSFCFAVAQIYLVLIQEYDLIFT